MKQLILAIIFSLLLGVPLANAANWQGTHPYDRPERMVHEGSHRNNKRSWGYREIRRYYASHYRTYTHMLHPYYRKTPYQMYGRIPDNQFNYPYGYFASEVIRPDKYYESLQ